MAAPAANHALENQPSRCGPWGSCRNEDLGDGFKVDLVAERAQPLKPQLFQGRDVQELRAGKFLGA